MSDARVSHLMAVDHGWIDVTVRPATPAGAGKTSGACAVALSANGERLLREEGDFAAAAVNGAPLGYRLPAPAGKLDLELSYAGCTDGDVVVKQPLVLAKDTLARISFDGSRLTVDGTAPYAPASLDAVRAEVVALQGRADAADQRLARTNTLMLAGLALNVAVLALVLWTRRRS